MGIIAKTKTEKWVLCHDEQSTFHIIKLTVGSTLESGQPIMEEFDTEAEIRERVIELTKDESFFDNQINPQIELPIAPELTALQIEKLRIQAEIDNAIILSHQEAMEETELTVEETEVVSEINSEELSTPIE